jgi:DNA topoisomerase-2
VRLNGKKFPVKGWCSYLGLFNGVTPPTAFKRINEQQEVEVGMSSDRSFQQISFINSITITKGSDHISHIANQVVEKLILKL